MPEKDEVILKEIILRTAVKEVKQKQKEEIYTGMLAWFIQWLIPDRTVEEIKREYTELENEQKKNLRMLIYMYDYYIRNPEFDLQIVVLNTLSDLLREDWLSDERKKLLEYDK